LIELDNHIDLTNWLGAFKNYFQALVESSSRIQLDEFLESSATSFIVIAVAEMGDKSQLVCMTLAAKHKAWPILLGSTAAFAILNGLAVTFGLVISNWLPDFVVAFAVALLFAVFGIHSLLADEEDNEEIKESSGHGIFITTFLLIFLDEFGDKTQLAVVGLSSTSEAKAAWLGSTLALAGTSVLGVIAGKTVLQKIPLFWLHKISGLIFLILAFYAGHQAYTHFDRNLLFWERNDEPRTTAFGFR